MAVSHFSQAAELEFCRGRQVTCALGSLFDGSGPFGSPDRSSARDEAGCSGLETDVADGADVLQHARQTGFHINRSAPLSYVARHHNRVGETSVYEGGSLLMSRIRTES